jgi:hypothetical protein
VIPRSNGKSENVTGRTDNTTGKEKGQKEK